MPAPDRSFIQAILVRIPTLLTLALLAGLGVWGARGDWKMPDGLRFWAKDTAAPRESSEDSIKVVSETGATQSGESGSLAPRRIEFAEADAVEKAGIRLAPVEVRPPAPLPALDASTAALLGSGSTGALLAAASLTPDRVPLAQYVTAQGAVDFEPSRYARLTSRASGSVWRVEKEIGDSFHAGEILAIIDSAEVGKAKADLLLSLTQVRMRTALVQRLKSASGAGAVADQRLIDAENSLREARIRLFNDHQALLNLGLPVHLKDLQDLSEDDLVRKLRLLALPQGLAKNMDADSLTANLLPLTAPFAGKVVQRNVAIGEVVLTAHPKTLFVIADVRYLHIDLNVNPEDMARVRIGQTVDFRPDGKGAELAFARVSHIAPEIDEKTRRVLVHAEVYDTDGRLRPNAFGIGRIVIREVPEALVVPADAVQSDGGTDLVFVRLSDRSFEARPVRVGLRDGDRVQVSGVHPRDEVVTAGSFALKSQLLKHRIAGGDD